MIRFVISVFCFEEHKSEVKLMSDVLICFWFFRFLSHVYDFYVLQSGPQLIKLTVSKQNLCIDLSFWSLVYFLKFIIGCNIVYWISFTVVFVCWFVFRSFCLKRNIYRFFPFVSHFSSSHLRGYLEMNQEIYEFK